MEHPQFGRPRRTLRFLGMWVASAVLVTTQLALPVAAAPAAPAAPARQAAPAAPTSTITLAVTAARTEDLAGVTLGDPVTSYKWIINEDNTGTTEQRNALPGSGCSPQDAGYPGSCNWASIAGLRSSAPVVAQGDQTTLNGTDDITLAPGRYLISVLADGYKLDGTPFTIPMEAPGVVAVPLQPLPLPSATIKAQVFADVTEANGQFDPGEDGLSGWAGKITDYLGQVNTDVFGNPLCTTYEFNDSNANGVQDRLWDPTWTGPVEEIQLDANNEPIVHTQGGKCLTGDINMDGLLDDGPTKPAVRRPGARPDAGPRGPHDPEPRSQPLRPVDGPADRRDLGPDHHPRGQPRLGRLGDGGRHRPRHRVRGGRRAVPGPDLRLRAGSDDRLLDESRF